ncbi:DUF1328 domain-containing protein [Saccharibacillus qingshengii]|uniref:DUF1328 domain-containing protein n=1 Tax=Saccharibacillus qingshengii TaxID=1763540 RepID=UPI0015571720|nr:DUF1328 family protein [Saccharibacillus qingshengii]
MMKWSLILLVVAVVLGIFGFVGIIEATAAIFKVLFWVFLALFVISLFFGRGRSTR